jgi:hypothetical protein
MLDRGFMKLINKIGAGRQMVTLIVLLLNLSCASRLHNSGDRKNPDALRQIATETPVPLSFSQMSSTNNFKSTGATLSFYYRSAENYEEVKKFYTKELTVRGWSGPEEDTYGGGTQGIRFRKGEYSIAVFYDDVATQGWDYAITYGWRIR